MEITPITAVIGAITGCVSLIWNIIIYSHFDLEIYHHYLSFKHIKKPLEGSFSAYIRKLQNSSHYSDDAIVIQGWFKFVLRKEGQRVKNHHLDLLTIDLDEELRVFLSTIVAEPLSHTALFLNKETKDLKLYEGCPMEIEVHSNSLFLKKDWASRINLSVDELEEKLNELIEKGEYKINVQLTTYKYPLTYEKRNNYFQRENLRRRLVRALQRPL